MDGGAELFLKVADAVDGGDVLVGGSNGEGRCGEGGDVSSGRYSSGGAGWDWVD